MNAATNNIPVISLEQFLAQNDASPIYGDSGLHRSSEHVGKATHARMVERQAQKDRRLAERVAEYRRIYNQKVEAGELRPPTSAESLLATAGGSEDKESTHAARRVLEKRAARMAAAEKAKRKEE